MNDKLDILKNKQLKNIPENKKLKETDLLRIIKYTNNSIFGTECSIWQGYITNNKSKYINFYFNKNKIALHRLLYINYIGELYENVYLSYNCKNPGICCNINHFIVKKKNKKNNNKNTVEFDF